MDPVRRKADILPPGGLIMTPPTSGNTASNPSQPQQSGGLFGGAAATSQPQQSGGLFGGSAAPQPQQSGGLFGNNAASQPQQSGGLFGSAAATPQPQQSGGLFGAAAGTTPQPQQTGGMFGSSASTTQPQQTGGLFGGGSNTQSQQTGGLFGGAANTQPQQSGGLFGGAASSNTQPQQSGGLFGGAASSTPNPAAGGLFGSSTQQSQPQQTGGLFGSTMGQQQNQAQQPSNSLFGGLGQNNQSQSGAPMFGSLGATQNKPFGSSMMNPSASMVGSLTMGQGNAQQNTVPGTIIDVSNLRPTTRFNDLHADLKKQIESIDSFIRQQEAFSAQCEALLPNHSANVESIAPDVDLITGKIETVELALENDSRAIESAKALVKRDANDLMRCARVTENLTLPSQYHYGPSVTAATRTRAAAAPSGDDSYDVDLVGYFMRQVDTMQSTLDTYTSHMAEIENHLRVIEVSTVQQAQQLAAQRTGSRAGNSQDTVRELAETLRGFEHGILGAAGLVGSCREGVNELILGRIDTETREPQGYGGRRSVRF